jgi:hypothetical protein
VARRGGCKFEIRSTKSETNLKFEITAIPWKLTTLKSQIPNPKQIRKLQIPNQEPLAQPRCSGRNAFASHAQSLEKSWANRGRFLARAWVPPRPDGLLVSNLEFVWDLGFSLRILNRESFKHFWLASPGRSFFGGQLWQRDLTHPLIPAPEPGVGSREPVMARKEEIGQHPPEVEIDEPRPGIEQV